MAKITLQLDSVSIDLTKGNFVQQLEDTVNPSRVFQIGTEIASLATGALHDLPSDVTAKLALDKSALWTIPGQANLTFGLQADVSAAIRVRNSGSCCAIRLMMMTRQR